LKKYDFKYQEIDGTSPRGQKLIRDLSIMSVPTTIIEYNGVKKVAFVGVPQREKAIELIK
jgi:hypothetical protein